MQQRKNHQSRNTTRPAMTAFTVSPCPTFRTESLTLSKSSGTSVWPSRTTHFVRKRCRTHVQMTKSTNETPKHKKEEHNDYGPSKTAFRDFGKICLAATGIGIVVFFYDILASLLVLTIGGAYAIAVLFEVRGADTLIKRTLRSTRNFFSKVSLRVRDAWKALRREVRKGLED